MTKLTGIIDIHGESGVGKTLMALGIAPPDQIAYLFDDVKRPPVDIKQLGYYTDLAQLRQGKKLLEYHDQVLEQIKQIPDKCNVIIFDTWQRFGLSCQMWGKLHVDQLRERATMAAGQQFLYGQQWGEAYLYEVQVISQLANRFESVVLISHLKDHYESGAKTSKQEPNLGRDIPKACNFRVWLKRNPDSSVPIALVHKTISVTKYDKSGELEIVNLLPRRLKPLESETSVWQVIERYRKDPFGNRKPTEDELPTEFELSILDGILTAEQKEIWHQNIKEKERQAIEESLFLQNEQETVRERVQELKAEGLILPVIAQMIGDEFGNGWNLESVSKLYV